jgi:predicted transposase/invertase (TIGR01784 family)
VDQLETEEDYWIFMMKEATHAREAPEKAPEEVKEAYAILERHTWTRPECLAYEQAKIGLMDDMDSIQTAKEEGIEEGKEIGRKEEKMNMARAMVSQNLDHNLIATITGLTVAEIESLK